VVGMAGNMVVGGIVGVAVDATSGAMLEHVPNPVNAVLEPLAHPGPPTHRSRPAPKLVAPRATQAAPTS
jgi:hypothetical protein